MSTNIMLRRDSMLAHGVPYVPVVRPRTYDSGVADFTSMAVGDKATRNDNSSKANSNNLGMHVPGCSIRFEETANFAVGETATFRITGQNARGVRVIEYVVLSEGDGDVQSLNVWSRIDEIEVVAGTLSGNERSKVGWGSKASDNALLRVAVPTWVGGDEFVDAASDKVVPSVRLLGPVNVAPASGENYSKQLTVGPTGNYFPQHRCVELPEAADPVEMAIYWLISEEASNPRG